MNINQAVQPREDRPSPDQPPTCYMVFEHRQHCVCCGSDHSWSELYAYSPVQAKWGFGKTVTNLKAIFWPKYRLPIQQVRASSTKRIPFCHKCFVPSLEHSYELLDPPMPESHKVVGFGKPEPKPEPKTEPSTKAKDHATVDDLEDLLR